MQWIAQLLADAFSAAEDTAETLLLRSALGVLLRDLARRSADSRALVASATLPAVLQLLQSPTEQAPTEARLHDMVALTMRILAEEAGNEEMDDISRHLTIDVLREAWDNPRGSEGRLLPSVLDLVAIPASCKDLQPHATAHLEHVEQLVQKLLGVVIDRNAQKHLSDFLARVTSALGRPNKKTSRPPSPTTAAAPSPATAQTKKRRASRKRDRDDPEVDALQEARLRELLEKQRREFEELDAFEVEGLSSAASKKKQPPSPRVLAPPSPSPSPSPSPAPAPITQTTLIPESQTSIVPDSQHSSKRVRFSDDGGFGEPPPPSPPPTAPAKNRAQQPRGAEWLKKQMDSLYSPAARKPAATAVSTPSASKPSASAATGKTPGLKVVFGASRQQAASQTSAQHHPTAVVVAFTGFSNNEQLEKDLVGKAKALGAAVLARGVADSTLTHVVSFQGRRTTITLVGAVCGLWVVSQDWLDESHAAGRFVDESPFGQRFPKSPFEGKAFCLSQDFVADTKPAIVEHCKTLISLGKGVLLEDGERHPADFTLVSSDHGGDGAGRGSSGITFTLRMFFDLIQPQL